MAQLLIRLVDEPVPEGGDPALYARRGDVVAAVGDDHVWSANEDRRRWAAEGGDETAWHGTYAVLHVTDLPPARAARAVSRLLRPAMPGEPSYDAPDAADRVVQVGAFAWRVDLDRLPSGVLRDLTDAGYHAATVRALREHVREKLTGRFLMNL